MNNYKPQTEALKNFGIDISKETIEKYALEKIRESVGNTSGTRLRCSG